MSRNFMKRLAALKREYDLAGRLQKTVYVVESRYYETREEAQAVVDTLCNAGYGVLEIQEYQIDA